MTAINLNADMGESYGAWQMGNDDALLRIVRSANIACGFHAGDPMHMAKTVEVAVANGVSLGAHPAFPDLQGFGRRAMHLTAKELSATVMYQVGALQAFAVANGTRLSHVKPHGALNNMACVDLDMATVIVQAVRRWDCEPAWCRVAHPYTQYLCTWRQPASDRKRRLAARCLDFKRLCIGAFGRDGVGLAAWSS